MYVRWRAKPELRMSGRRLSSLLMKRRRLLKTRLRRDGVYTGHFSLHPELEVEPHHQRRRGKEGGTPVWIGEQRLDRLLYIVRDGEVFTRAERLAMIAESNPHVEVEALQFWLSSGASIYDRDSDAGNAELALNILADSIGELEARRNYRVFSIEVVSPLPETWILTQGKVRRWIWAKTAD